MAQDSNNRLSAIILQWLAVPLCTFLVGFSGSQVIAVQNLHDTVLSNDHRLGATQKALEVETQARRDADANVMAVLERLVAQNSEVIGLFRMQQQMK